MITKTKSKQTPQWECRNANIFVHLVEEDEDDYESEDYYDHNENSKMLLSITFIQTVDKFGFTKKLLSDCFECRSGYFQSQPDVTLVSLMTSCPCEQGRKRILDALRDCEKSHLNFTISLQGWWNNSFLHLYCQQSHSSSEEAFLSIEYNQTFTYN